MRTLSVVLATVLLAACGPQTAPSNLVGGAARIDDGTPESLAILEFLNAEDTTVDVLDLEVGLDADAAQNLIDHRDGPDATWGTEDDDLFDAIVEVDDVPQIGPAALDSLLDYVRVQGLIEDVEDVYGTIDGVVYTQSEVDNALYLVNTRRHHVLDVGMGLDVRVADAIVAGRPFESIEEVAALPFAAGQALTRLRDYTENDMDEVAADLFPYTDGLWFESEGDYPLDIFTLTDQAPVTAETALDVFWNVHWYDDEIDVVWSENSVEVGPLSDFIGWRSDPEENEYDVAEWQNIERILSENLNGVQVFRVGESFGDGWVYGTVHVFAIGYTDDGDAVGVYTISIET